METIQTVPGSEQGLTLEKIAPPPAPEGRTPLPGASEVSGFRFCPRPGPATTHRGPGKGAAACRQQGTFVSRLGTGSHDTVAILNTRISFGDLVSSFRDHTKI